MENPIKIDDLGVPLFSETSELTRENSLHHASHPAVMVFAGHPRLDQAPSREVWYQTWLFFGEKKTDQNQTKQMIPLCFCSGTFFWLHHGDLFFGSTKHKQKRIPMIRNDQICEGKTSTTWFKLDKVTAKKTSPRAKVTGGSSQDLVHWLGSSQFISHVHGHNPIRLRGWKLSMGLLTTELSTGWFEWTDACPSSFPIDHCKAQFFRCKKSLEPSKLQLCMKVGYNH